MQSLPADITQALYRFVCAERTAAVLRADYVRIGASNDAESTRGLCDADATARKRRKSLKASILKHLRTADEIVHEDGAA